MKAATILVTRDADIKVADFGVSEKVSESIFGEIAGRFAYSLVIRSTLD